MADDDLDELAKATRDAPLRPPPRGLTKREVDQRIAAHGCAEAVGVLIAALILLLWLFSR